MTTDVEAVLTAYPRDQIDADNLAQFTGFFERRLVINRCDDCGTWHQPPNPLCPSCWSTNVTGTAVSGKGAIYLTMLLHQGPGIEPGKPMAVVVVELAEQEGLRYTAELVDYEPAELTIGQAVEVTWRDDGGAPWPVFRPAKG
jgi:uncharacterized protein